MTWRTVHTDADRPWAEWSNRHQHMPWLLTPRARFTLTRWACIAVLACLGFGVLTISRAADRLAGVHQEAR